MKKVNHHYVPCSYLQGFSIDNSKGRKSVVEIFDTKTKKNRSASVESIMYEKNFYETDIEGLPSDIAEEVFSELFEKGLSKVIEKIDNKEPLNIEEINQICSFIGFQEFRTHYRKNRMNEFYKKLGQYGVEVSDTDKKMFFNGMFMGEDIIGSMLRGRKWEILQSKDGEFITSDHPLYLCRPNEIPKEMNLGIGNSNLCFPLSKTSFLRVLYGMEDLPRKNGGTKNILYCDADEFFIKLSNRFSCRSIERFIVGKDISTMQDTVDIINGKKTEKEIEDELKSFIQRACGGGK